MASHFVWIAATAIVLSAISGATAGYWSGDVGAREAHDAAAMIWRV